MAASAPADLAVAFRSFGRRLAESMEKAEHHPDTLAAARALLPRLEQPLAEAARLVGEPSAGDVTTVGNTIAQHVEAVHADQWDERQLDQLRELATRAGQALRDIDDAAAGD